MKPITTELRELAQDMNWTEIIDHIHARNVLDGDWLDGDWLDSWHKAFDARCDAIDAVHAGLEQENDELGKTVYDMRREFDEWKHSLDTGWIRLPKDEDGEYIHIGDVMEWVHYEYDDPTIVRTVSGIGNGVFFAWSDEQGRYAQYEAPAYRHHHAPTVEDVLREFVTEFNRDDTELCDGEIIEMFAKRLQLKEDA